MGKKKKSQKRKVAIDKPIPQQEAPNVNKVDEFFSSENDINVDNKEVDLEVVDFESLINDAPEEEPDYSKIRYAMPELTEEQKALAIKFGFEDLLDVMPRERDKTPSESQVYLGKAEPKPGLTSVKEDEFNPNTMPQLNDFDKTVPKVEMTQHAQDLLRKAAKYDYTYIGSDAFNIDGKTLLRSPEDFAKKVLEVQNDDSITPAPDKELELLIDFVKYEDYEESLTPEQIKALFYLPKHNRTDILDRLSMTNDLVEDSPPDEKSKRGLSLEEMKHIIDDTYSRNIQHIMTSLQVLMPFFKKAMKLNKLDASELEAVKVMYENVGLMEEWEVSKQYEKKGYLIDAYHDAMEEIYDLLSNLNYDFDPEAQVAYAVVEKFKDSVAKDKYLDFKPLYKLLVDLWYKGFIDLHMPEQYNASVLLGQAIQYFEANPIYEEELYGDKYVVNMLDRIKVKRGEITSPAVKLTTYNNAYANKLKEENEMPLNVSDDIIANSVSRTISNAPITADENNPFIKMLNEMKEKEKAKSNVQEEERKPTTISIMKPEPMNNHTGTRLNFAPPPEEQVKEFQRPRHGGIGPSYQTTEAIIQANGSPDLIGLPRLSGYERLYKIPYEGIIISCDDGRFYLLEPQAIAEINALRKYTQEEHNKTIKASMPEDAFIRPTTLIHDAYWKTPTITGYVPYHCYIVRSPVAKELVWLNQEDYYEMCRSALAADQAAGLDPRHFSETTGSNLYYANAYNQAFTILKGSVNADYADKRINTPILPTPVMEPEFIEVGSQAYYGNPMELTHGYGVGNYTEIQDDGWCGIGCGYTPIGNNLTYAGLNTLLGGMNNMRLINVANVGSPVAAVAPVVTGANSNTNNTTIFGTPIPNPGTNGGVYGKIDTSVVWDKATNTLVPNPAMAANNQNTMYIGQHAANNTNYGNATVPTQTPITFGGNIPTANNAMSNMAFMNQPRATALPQQPTVVGFTNMTQFAQNQNTQFTGNTNAFGMNTTNNQASDFAAGYNKAKAELEPVIQQMQAQLQAMANEINKLRVNAQGVYQPVTNFQHTQGLGTLNQTTYNPFGANNGFMANNGMNITTPQFGATSFGYSSAFTQPNYGVNNFGATSNFGYNQPQQTTLGGGAFGFSSQPNYSQNTTGMFGNQTFNTTAFNTGFAQPVYNNGFNSFGGVNNGFVPTQSQFTTGNVFGSNGFGMSSQTMFQPQVPQNTWTAPNGNTIVQTNVTPVNIPQTQPWTAGTQAPATSAFGNVNNVSFASNFQRPVGSQVTATPYMGGPSGSTANFLSNASYGTSPLASLNAYGASNPIMNYTSPQSNAFIPNNNVGVMNVNQPGLY